MHPFVWQTRMRSGNPIFPYCWIARYEGGGELKQYDVDGYHLSRDIDRKRLKELVILGHPHSPITLPILFLPSQRPLDEVVIKAQVDIDYELGTKTVKAHRVKHHFGYRYGQDLFLMEIDDDGRVWKLPLMQVGKAEWANGGQLISA